MWTLASMRAVLRRGLAIGAGIGMTIGLGSAAAPAWSLEPTCLLTPGALPIRWTRAPEADRPELDRWCAAVGPPIIRRGADERRGAGDLVVAVWNVQVGAGALEKLVGDLRTGRLTDGEPTGHFALLLQEARRDLGDSAAHPPPGVRTARRIAPAGRGLDILSVAEKLDLHLLYVPSMRNGNRDQPAEDRGSAILSTLPLRDPWALELPLERQRRVAVAARVKIDGADEGLLLVNAHFENRSSWSGAIRSLGSGRTRQARWLASALGAEAAVALGGDFNTWLRGANAEALELLRRSFPLPAEPPGSPTLVTRFSRDRAVDHLFFRLPAGWTASSRVAEDRYGSDHRPLVGRILVK